MVDIHHLNHTADQRVWQSTVHTVLMPTDPQRAPKDRRLDRHDPNKPARVIRPDPPELWDRLGALVGVRERSGVISDLIARYLDGRPMPKRRRPPGGDH